MNKYTDPQYRDFAAWVESQINECCKALPYPVTVQCHIGAQVIDNGDFYVAIIPHLIFTFDGYITEIPMTHMFQNDEWAHIKPLFENGTIKNIYVGSEALKLIDSLRQDISIDPTEQTC